MGFLYQLPTDKSEDFVTFTPQEVVVESYGLPRLFLLYIALIQVFLFAAFFLLINSFFLKMLHTQQPLDKLIAWAALLLPVLCSLTLLGAWVYRKRYLLSSEHIEICHVFLGFPLIRKRHFISWNQWSFEINHFMESPNMARIQRSSPSAYENRGYFELYLQNITAPEDKIYLDRHSLKNLLQKTQKLFQEAQESLK